MKKTNTTKSAVTDTSMGEIIASCLSASTDYRTHSATPDFAKPGDFCPVTGFDTTTANTIYLNPTGTTTTINTTVNTTGTGLQTIDLVGWDGSAISFNNAAATTPIALPPVALRNVDHQNI